MLCDETKYQLGRQLTSGNLYRRKESGTLPLFIGGHDREQSEQLVTRELEVLAEKAGLVEIFKSKDAAASAPFGARTYAAMSKPKAEEYISLLP